ncbi:MAG: hypothetical protein NDJ72_05195 [Elusimicrobia bacterium]|nr:hypothetical protein [Elusimicrobiota bacterium]
MTLRPPGSVALIPPGLGQARAEQLRAESGSAWTLDDTERWLTDYPLPATFKWNGERAYPRYTLKKGYGFWLRVAGQYYPALRGLFALCHEVLAALRPGVDKMPSGEQLAALVQAWDRSKELPLTADDLAAPRSGTPHPGENAPTFG